jgi:hypothetical protein
VTLKNVAGIFYATGGGVSPPSSLALGYAQVQQLNMYNKGQSLAVEQDMSDHTYVAPLRGHDQQELTAKIPSGSSFASRGAVTIAGIMSGQVRSVQVYLTDDAAPQNAAVFTAPAEVTLQYAGVNYAQYNDGSSAVWNLLDSSAPSSVPANSMSFSGSTLTTSSVASTWAVLPFSQPTNADFEATMLVAGKPVTNGAITLFITSPDTTKNWTLHVIPTLNSAIAYSRGSANVLIG